MKKWLLVLSVFLAVFVLTGCLDPVKDDDDKTVLGRRKFWATNIDTNQPYQIDAELLESRTICDIWVEKGADVSMAQVKKVADEYYNVYRSVNNNFGYNINVEGYGVVDQVGYANLLATSGALRSKKLTILLLDINNYKTNGPSDVFVAGYFWAGDLYSKNSVLNSNECAMIYMDAYHQTPGEKEFNATIAHELQHLFNFTSTVVIDREYLMDTWIDEGLSETTYRLYTGGHNQGRLAWYSEDPLGTIAKGNNFYLWDNYIDDPDTVLDDYSTVYLFFQYLRARANTNGIFREISMSEDDDFNAVLNALSESSWNNLLRDWYAANYIGSSSGYHGYRNDTALNSLTIHYAHGGSNSIWLYPGEGVYSKTDSSYPLPTDGTNIKYDGLNGTELIQTGSIPSDGALLTYNVNTNMEGSPESGTTTGIAAAVLRPNISASRSVSRHSYSISLGDMLRRNNANSSFDNVKTNKLNAGTLRDKIKVSSFSRGTINE